MKICRNCGEKFDTVRCVVCGRKSSAKYKATHAEKVKAKSAAYIAKNKEKIAETSRKYREQNREKIRKVKRKWVEENRERLRELKRKWIAKYPEKAKASRAKYQAAHPERMELFLEWKKVNPEKVLAKNIRWQAANPEKVKAIRKKYYEKNREKLRVDSARRHASTPEANRLRKHVRRAREKSNGGLLSPGIVEKLFALQKGKCACCGLPLGKEYHIDHIMPIALGGPNEDRNVQLLRKKCNLSKQAKHPIDFMQSKGFLL